MSQSTSHLLACNILRKPELAFRFPDETLSVLVYWPPELFVTTGVRTTTPTGTNTGARPTLRRSSHGHALYSSGLQPGVRENILRGLYN
jgi:hypothetical protein